MESGQTEMTDRMFKQKEVVCTTFLGIASRDLKEGRYLHALTIFGALARTDFTRRQIALQGEAVAMVRMGQYKEAFSEAEKMLRSILDANSEPTVFKADNLKSLAEVSIGLQHFDDIDAVLEEAAQIYDQQHLTKANGSVVHLQSIVALWRQDYRAAMEKLTWANILSEIKIPEIVPSGFGIEAPPEPAIADQSSIYALVGAQG